MSSPIFRKVVVTQDRTIWAKPLSMRMFTQLDELLVLAQALLQGKDKAIVRDTESQ